jgi:hypothetical protein
MVEKDERPDHAMACHRQDAPHFEAADIASTLLDDDFDHRFLPDRAA